MMMQPSGASWLFPLLMVIVMAAFVAVIAVVARAALSRPTDQPSADNDRAVAGGEPPLTVLRRRFMRDEIELEEFERRVELLIRSESSSQRALSTSVR